MAKLKKFNGRGHGDYKKGHIYVAAYSQKQAADLIGKATGVKNVSVSEISDYYSKGSWGSRMNGIEPTEPCLYASKHYSDQPVRIL